MGESRPDSAMDKDLAGDPWASQLSARYNHYSDGIDPFGYGASSGTSVADHRRGFLWTPPIYDFPRSPQPQERVEVKSARHLWGLRKKSWWKHVGFVWIFVTILLPTAAYASSIHK